MARGLSYGSKLCRHKPSYICDWKFIASGTITIIIGPVFDTESLRDFWGGFPDGLISPYLSGSSKLSYGES